MGRLFSLSANITLAMEIVPWTNTVAYYALLSVTKKNVFIIWTLVANIIKLFWCNLLQDFD
jgi:hypothetical protein